MLLIMLILKLRQIHRITTVSKIRIEIRVLRVNQTAESEMFIELETTGSFKNGVKINNLLC